MKEEACMDKQIRSIVSSTQAERIYSLNIGDFDRIHATIYGTLDELDDLIENIKVGIAMYRSLESEDAQS